MKALFTRFRSCCVGLLLLCVLVLVGCDGYPADWKGVDKPLFASCPDISGTYRIGTNNAEGVGESHRLDNSLFRNILPPRTAQRWHWETMTISGDPREALQVTLMHSPQTMDNYLKQLFAKGGMGYYQRQYESMQDPATRWDGGFAKMTDEQYASNLSTLYLNPLVQHTLTYGKDYECSSGWITGERIEHDPGPDRSQPRPDETHGIVRFGKTRDGYLVAEAIHAESHAFNVWCGDGCTGFSLGTWDDHDWKRWEATAPAWTGAVPRPWAEPFRRDMYPSTESGYSTGRVSEVDGLVRPLLPAGVTLDDVQMSGRDAVLVVGSAGTDAFAAFVKVLDASYRFTSVHVQSLAGTVDNRWRMEIRAGLKPRASSTSTEDILSRVRPLLPANAVVRSIEPQDGGFMLTLRGLSQPDSDALVKTFNTTGGFRQATVNMFFTGADYNEIRIRFFER